MTDQEVLALLRRIDNGYKPTDKEETELSNIKNIDWKGTESIPESIERLTSLQRLYLNNSKLSVLPESISNLTGEDH